MCEGRYQHPHTNTRPTTNPNTTHNTMHDACPCHMQSVHMQHRVRTDQVHAHVLHLPAAFISIIILPVYVCVCVLSCLLNGSTALRGVLTSLIATQLACCVLLWCCMLCSCGAVCVVSPHVSFVCRQCNLQPPTSNPQPPPVLCMLTRWIRTKLRSRKSREGSASHAQTHTRRRTRRVHMHPHTCIHTIHTYIHIHPYILADIHTYHTYIHTQPYIHT